MNERNELGYLLDRTLLVVHKSDGMPGAMPHWLAEPSSKAGRVTVEWHDRTITTCECVMESLT